MSNPINKFFNNKRWNEVKTRKIVLIFAIVMTILYVVISVLLKVIFGFDLNDQLTIEVFAFCKWLVLAGAGITIAKVAKGKTNSDNDESQIDTTDADYTMEDDNQ